MSRLDTTVVTVTTTAIAAVVRGIARAVFDARPSLETPEKPSPLGWQRTWGTYTWA